MSQKRNSQNGAYLRIIRLNSQNSSKYSLTSILCRDMERFQVKKAEKVIFNKLFAEISSILTHSISLHFREQTVGFSP